MKTKWSFGTVFAAACIVAIFIYSISAPKNHVQLTRYEGTALLCLSECADMSHVKMNYTLTYPSYVKIFVGSRGVTFGDAKGQMGTAEFIPNDLVGKYDSLKVKAAESTTTKVLFRPVTDSVTGIYEIDRVNDPVAMDILNSVARLQGDTHPAFGMQIPYSVGEVAGDFTAISTSSGRYPDNYGIQFVGTTTVSGTFIKTAYMGDTSHEDPTKIYAFVVDERDRAKIPWDPQTQGGWGYFLFRNPVMIDAAKGITDKSHHTITVANYRYTNYFVMHDMAGPDMKMESVDFVDIVK